MASDRPPGILSKQLFFSLYVPAIMLALGQSMIAPVIPGFARSFQVSFATASLVFVMAPVGALVSTFPVGILLDRVGRKPLLITGPLIAACASLATPFASDFYQLLFYRFVAGAAQQLWMQARLAMITDTARYDQRARQINYMGGMTRAGQLFGPAVGGLLAAAVGVWVPFTLHAALMVLSTIPSFFLLQETAPGRTKIPALTNAEPYEDTGWKGVLKYVLTFQMMVFFAIQVFANVCRGGQESGALNLYATYAYDVGPETLGLMNTVAIVVGLPTPFITGNLMDRFSRRAVIAPAFALYGLALVLMAGTDFLHLPFTGFLLAYIILQAFQGTTNVSMQVLGSDYAPPFARGRFFAIWRMVSQLATTLSPALYALMAENVSYGAGFIMLGAFSLSATVLVAGVLHEAARPKPEPIG